MHTSRLSLFALAAAVAGLLSLPTEAQAPYRSNGDALKVLKEQNRQLLEQQAALIQKLDELEKEAKQLRIFAART